MSRFELKIAPDVIWLLTAALMWLAAALTTGVTIPTVARIVGAGFFLAIGIALIVLVRVELDQAQTTWHPSEPGRTSSLVTSGAFRFSRNPMYLGMWLVLVGWGMALADPLALALTAAFIGYVTRFQIVPEERVLAALMGDRYREYASRVRRWI